MTDTLTRLGNAAEQALGQGDLAEADRLCAKALELDPRNYKCLVLRAFVSRERGRPEDASALAERAIRLRPTMVEAYFQLALSMLALGRFSQAAISLRKAVELRPEVPAFHFNLGVAYEHLGEHALSSRSYRQATKLDQSDPEAPLRVASLLVAEGRFQEARIEIETILSALPNSSAANLVMAELCIAEDGMASAEPYVRRALEFDPENPSALALLGFRESELGGFAQSEALFRRSIEIRPDQGQAYLGLTQARKMSSSDRPLIAQMTKISDSAVLVPAEAASLRFAIAKAYDDLGEFGSAMRYFDEAHRFGYLAQFGKGEFDQERYRKIIDSAISTALGMAPEAAKGSAPDQPLPILIVGMIRSGTTLTEQILSRHPDVGAAGEHPYWQTHAGQTDRLTELVENPSRIVSLAEGYLRALRDKVPTQKCVTDKYPGNYLRLGLIRSALPHAKVIHCRRQPIDNALSIYMTPIRNAPVFSHSKEAIVFAYRAYERLMEHWRNTLPKGNFLEVDYEELVGNPEPMIRKMVEFCGLDWNDRCLSPELNEKDVATPSLWQVRQPIYRSSVDRWKRYEPWLGALAELR